MRTASRRTEVLGSQQVHRGVGVARASPREEMSAASRQQLSDEPDIALNPNQDNYITLHSSKQCDLKMIDKSEIINKRHCRSFDFIESLDDPQPFSSSMEYSNK
ncbi:hypothetical protein FQA47_008753, partial [Oryzias melastigma]